jgi:hypothetical protein
MRSSGFVNAAEFKVRLYVTDRPLTDPEGTGLSRLTVASDRTSPYSGPCDEHAAADPTQRFIDFGPSSIGGSWNFGANQSITIIAKAEDGNGNACWFNDMETTAASTFRVYKDTEAPVSGTVTTVYASQFLDIAAGNVTYVTDVTSFGFTPTDTPTTSSGVRLPYPHDALPDRYSPSAPIEAMRAWKRYLERGISTRIILGS